MEFYQLRYFKMIAKYQSIRKAAEELYVSEPALSKALQSLEKELGVLLFDRIKKRLYINEAGKEVLEYTDSLFEQTEHLYQKLDIYKDKQQTIRIFSTSTVGLRYFVASYSAANPNYFVSNHLIQPDEVISSIREDSSDIVISSSVINAKDVECIYLCTDKMMMAVPSQHPLYEKTMLSKKDLMGQDVLRLKGSGIGSNTLDERFKANGINLTYYWVYDYAVYDSMLLSTRYLSHSSMLAYSYFNSTAKYRYHFIPIEGDDMVFDYYICILKGREKLAEDFKNCIMPNVAKLFSEHKLSYLR